MKSIVCCKQVIDPEAPSKYFQIDPERNELVPSKILPLFGSQPICYQRRKGKILHDVYEQPDTLINPFDENALEAALRVKDHHSGKVTAIFLGNNFLSDVVKKPLSMGADELILLEDEAYEGGDSWSTAYALAAAIKKIGDYDLIFCGRQASDSDSGQVGSGIAEMLGIPCITLARKIEIENGAVRVERVIEDGYQIVEVSLPALITVSNELGLPRLTTVKQIMASSKKQPIIWKPTDLNIDPSKIGAAGRKSNFIKLFQPVSEVMCEFIEADSPTKAGEKLAEKLRGMGLF